MDTVLCRAVTTVVPGTRLAALGRGGACLAGLSLFVAYMLLLFTRNEDLYLDCNARRRLVLDVGCHKRGLCEADRRGRRTPTSSIGMRKLVVKDTDRDERIHPRTAGGQRAAELRAEM